MFKDEVKKNIFNSIINDMERYNIKPNEYLIYLDNRINYEYNKAKKEENNFEKLSLYDDIITMNDMLNYNIVLEDFIGKDKRLNVYNSVLDPKYSIYFDGENNKNVNYLFIKNKNNLIFNIKSLFANLSIFSIKHIISFLLLIIQDIFLIILKFISLLIFGFVDIIVFILFKMLKFFIKIKYLIIKKNNTIFNLFNCLNQFLIGTFKFIINIINSVFFLFNDIFNNNVEMIFNFIKNMSENNLYSNNILNSKVDRDFRSLEHKELLNKIKNMSLNTLKEYLQHSNKYIKQFNFYKQTTKAVNPDILKNPSIKSYFTELERIEKINIKKDIIKYKFNDIGKKINKNENKILICENKINNIILNYINKVKMIINDLEQKKELNI